MKTVVTHNGAFHADDVYGVAVLELLFENLTIVRTRDPDLILKGDFVVDVGGIWAEQENRFDHHQKGFAGQRSGGVGYASAGLVWRCHGFQCVQKLVPSANPEEISRIVRQIDEELVQHLDRADTGVSNGAPGLFGLSALIDQFNPDWMTLEAATAGVSKEEGKAITDAILLEAFKNAVAVMTNIILNAIRVTASSVLGERLVRAGRLLHQGKVLLLERSGLVWEPVVCAEMPEVLYVIYPDSSDQQFQLRTVPVKPWSFQARQDLPAAWAGLRNESLSAVTGVSDAVFCHNGRFIAGAKSLDGALSLAALALNGAGPES